MDQKESMLTFTAMHFKRKQTRHGKTRVQHKTLYVFIKKPHFTQNKGGVFLQSESSPLMRTAFFISFLFSRLQWLFSFVYRCSLAYLGSLSSERSLYLLSEYRLP